MESNNDFSRSLALLRREKGVSQREAARELGISQALLSHYENGVREPGLLFGTTIGAEELYDASAEKGNVLRGSIVATLNKKLLVNSLDMLFDLLGRVGSKEAVTAASNYLGDAIYKMFRHLYRAPSTQNEGFFSIPANHFLAGCTDADMTYSEADYLDALAAQVKDAGRDSFPVITNDTLAQSYPGAYQSLLQIVHNTGERVNKALEQRRK